MPAATPPAGGDESPVSNPYTPTEPPRLILVTGTAIDDQTLDNLTGTRAFAAVIPLGPKEDDSTASVWERIADRRELVPHTPFKLLSLMVNASRGNLESRDDAALAYEALELIRDKPSRLLRGLNKGAKDDSGIGVAGIQLPTKFVAMPLRWLAFGAARSRLLRLTTHDGQWDVTSVLQAASNIPAEPAAALHPIASRARSELASVYRRSFIADCAVGGVELVFAGIREGDEAHELAAALKSETRHALGQLHYYEHHGPTQRVRTGELVGLLRDLRTGSSRFAEWHHFSATGLPHEDRPIPSPKRKARQVLTWTAASLAVVLVLASAWYFLIGPDQEGCGEPFERDEATGQCLPVDDGNGCVNPVLRPACEAVARQNEAVGDDDPAFTIAVALPLTFQGDDANSPQDIANQIQGAAAAQALINQNQTPKARILLTDLGPSNSAWDEAAEAILERRRDDDIIAVTGLSASYEDTKLFIDRMRNEGMVVMGSTITGDNMLNGAPETNTTFRVGPTNTQEAVALAAFVREHGDLCDVFNVSDSDRSYDYSITLNEAFKAQQAEAGCAESPPRPFTYNGANVEEVNPALFNETVAAMCGEIQEDSYLFFAGLSRFALPSLIRSLSLREGDCLEHRITIVTGDNASSIPHDRAVVNDLRAANVNLYYIGLAHPDQWASAGEEHHASAEQMKSAVDQLMHQFGTEANLENGQALMSFDAFWVTALNAQGQGETVTADSLADQLRSFSGRTATGPLEFDERGNPVGKTLTVLAATTDLDDPVEVVELVTAA